MKTERQKLFAQRKKIDEERAELRAKLNEHFGEEDGHSLCVDVEEKIKNQSPNKEVNITKGEEKE